MAGRSIHIVGTGGLAREVAQLLDDIGGWQIEGFIAERPEDAGLDLGPAKVLGDDAWFLASDRDGAIAIAIGHPAAKARTVERYAAAGDRFSYPNLVHPRSYLDPRQVQLGRGNLVTVGSVFTVDIEVGDFNLFNWHATIGHDAVIGSSCVINPGAHVSGGCRIGDRVLLGTGAIVLEGRSVGDGARVGAGAVVTHDVPAGVTVVGVPARAAGTPAP